VDFTATSPAENPDDQHTVVLTIDGYPTDLLLQEGSGGEVTQTIGKVYNYPNPMQDNTRFVFESGLTGGAGTIRVFSVAGRPVARISFRFNGGGSGIVEWDGRDSAGDEMGNGTYLYRVEIDTGEGIVVSDMQRLVMMR
jgi:flagellar hook assembly protein FlgD